MAFHVLIPAAGFGSRMESDLPKQYLLLNGAPLIAHVLALFCASHRIASVHVVLSESDAYWQNLPAEIISNAKLNKHFCGGETRAQTVLNGLNAIKNTVANDDWILVHDAARAGLTEHLLNKLINTLADDAVGGLLALPLADTLKRADDNAVVQKTVPRNHLWQAQTPQMFRYGLLVKALKNFSGTPTDEAQAIEALGLQPKLVVGALRNLKVTYAQDLEVLAALMQMTEKKDNDMRIGHGFDVHRLVTGRKCIIGGVEIPFEKGLDGHSDADVLLHAICDALLGAAALGDIGKHFPPTDMRFKGIDSRELLRHVVDLLRKKNYQVHNIDVTVICELPKLSPHTEKMRANIASDCAIDVDCINVKATTTEKLGFTGRGEGIAAEAVCLITKL